MKKIFVSVIMFAYILSLNSLDAQACDKTPECYSTKENIICGTMHGTYAYTHYVTEPNGYTYGCSVHEESSDHTITCAGCGAYLRSEIRTCNLIHSNARCNLSQRGLCQH